MTAAGRPKLTRLHRSELILFLSGQGFCPFIPSSLIVAIGTRCCLPLIYWQSIQVPHLMSSLYGDTLTRFTSKMPVKHYGRGIVGNFITFVTHMDVLGNLISPSLDPGMSSKLLQLHTKPLDGVHIYVVAWYYKYIALYTHVFFNVN